ncbi:MAG: DNA polymerase IV, partial [Planctomycetia bacterium]|nr:DNA polymerase IV [Planctomycetia bacterium]
MDAFFASVEVLDDPSLKGLPLIIGHPGPRGVVSTASYEARKFGVHSALPSTEALRRCPEGVWRSPRGGRYGEISRQVMQVFREFTPLVEPLSVDEAFLDIEGSLKLYGGAIAIAHQIRERVFEQTGGLTVSIGVAPNKFLAKLASDLDKPDGLTVVDPDGIQELLDPL